MHVDPRQVVQITGIPVVLMTPSDQDLADLMQDSRWQVEKQDEQCSASGGPGTLACAAVDPHIAGSRGVRSVQ
jgi:hypothetical protein